MHDESRMTGPTHPVLRQDGIALWRQIADRIRDDIIGSGASKPGAQLPTEAEMSARFGVNRHTVRRALEELSRDGSGPGRAGARQFRGRGRAGLRGRGAHPFLPMDPPAQQGTLGPRAAAAGSRPADQRVAAGLGIRTGSRVVLLERVGFADDRPVSLTRHYFPAARLKGILAALAGDAQHHRSAASRRHRRLSAPADPRHGTAADADRGGPAAYGSQSPCAGYGERQRRSRRRRSSSIRSVAIPPLACKSCSNPERC